MPTYLESALLPTDSTGSYLLVTGVRNLNRSDLERDDTRHAIAISGHLDLPGGIDLLASVTLPRPASKSDARGHSRMAKQQLELAESGEYGPQQSAHYRDNYWRYEYAAHLAMTEQRWLPSSVVASRNGRIVASIVTDTPSLLGGSSPDRVYVRSVDADSGEIVLEQRLKATKLGLVSPSYRRFTRLLGVDAAGERLLVLEQTGSRSAPTVVLQERALREGLPVETITEALRFSPNLIVKDGGEFWISCAGAYPERGAYLTLLDKKSGKKIDEISLSREPTSIAAAPNATMIVCALQGGAVWVVDLATKTIRKFSPHIGAGRDDWPTVHVADSEAFFVSATSNQLTLTSLSDGVSAPLKKPGDVKKACEPFDDVDTSVILAPALAVLGDRIAVAEGGSVRALDSDVAAYDDRFVSEVGRPGARKPVRVSKKAPFEETVKKARLAPHTDILSSYRSPAVMIRTKKLGKRGWAQPGVQHAPALGGSRLGGWPDLPEESKWPTWQGRPMAFLGQFNLAEARAAQPELRLPDSGLLSFFLGCSGETYTRDADERARFMVELLHDAGVGDEPGWLVEYTPATAALRRLEFKEEPLPELFDPTSLRLQAGGKALPDEQSAVFERLDLTNAEKADYLEMLEQLQKSHENHQLMGYASVIQFTPPELYCEAGGFDFPTDEGSDEYKTFIGRAWEWTLLLALTSDPHPDFLWGDGGKFYFYIRRDALAELDFSDTRIFFEN